MVPTWVVCAAGANTARHGDLTEKDVSIIETEVGVDGRPAVDALLARLAERGITRLLIEGGGTVGAAFLAAGLVDRIAWFRAPAVIGGDGLAAIAAFGLDRLADAPAFERVRRTETGGRCFRGIPTEEMRTIMFTGIVTDLGKVRSVTRTGDTRFEFETAYDTDEIEIGASICCSGACMTVIDKGPNWFAISASDESLSCTTMGDWREGSPVNFERSLRMGDEMGGHIVSGHVDSVAEVVAVTPENESVRLQFRVPEGMAKYIASKCSVAIDGVSMTVNEVEGDIFGGQRHSSHSGSDDPGNAQGRVAGESGNRHARALCCAPSREGIAVSDLDYLSSPEEIIEDARNGRMYILVDDQDRENEGDLIIPAQMATPDAINFMAKYGRGLVCLALTRERIAELDLPFMARENESRHQTAFTVSIEARDGCDDGDLGLRQGADHRRRHRPDQGQERHRDAGPHLPAGGPRRRFVGPCRPYRGGGRPFPGWPVSIRPA